VRLTPPFRFVVVGSPGGRRQPRLSRPIGAPDRPEDLRDHTCLRQRLSNGAIALWRFLDGTRPQEVSVAGPLIAHDFPTLLAAALEGVGLAQIPEPVAKAAVSEHRLRRLRASFAPAIPGVFLYHSGRRDVLPKLRAFIDHVKRVSVTDENIRIG
jgi:DNA-binding transcriptional LysR family regulator